MSSYIYNPHVFASLTCQHACLQISRNHNTRFPFKNFSKAFCWNSLTVHIVYHSTTLVSFLHLLQPPPLGPSRSLLTSYSSSSMTDCLWTFTLASSEGSSWARAEKNCYHAELSGRKSRVHNNRENSSKTEIGRDDERTGKDMEGAPCLRDGLVGSDI